MPHVVVVGGGITGLTAARRLLQQGADVKVVEASDRFGGEIRTVRFEGHDLDVGAEALHTAAPRPVELVEELGLGDELVAARSAPTWIVRKGRLHPLPAGMGPAGPTRLWPLVTSGLLSPLGLARAAVEPLVPSTSTRDVSVGDFLAHRFGDEVTDRLVDPLLGGIHAGDVHRLSLTAATPQLAALAEQHRSLVLGRRGASSSGPTGAGFVTLRGGLARLADALVDDLSGARLLPGTAAERLRVRDGRSELHLDSGELLVADRVVLAVPARAAGRIVRDAHLREDLGRLRAASVSVVLLAYPRAAVEGTPAERGTGLLVPAAERGLLRAATFLTCKWPHLAGSNRFLVRVSAGRIGVRRRLDRLDNRTLVARLHDELVQRVGIGAPPDAARVVVWPRGMPQLEVGHEQRLARIRHELPPGVVLAGAAYDGLGLASCIPAGEHAADAALESGTPAGVR